ncbi:NAD(P)-dependent oxidoreductase [Aurantiacibacter sediminis]|uniref:2-hydroxyacid dehydrogenase n=1 Tax=Aurantiacibacter sediminis TaxID=2793064 RepID=A0ABS0N6L2_9SPHN|nr:NAD(P)-dependent oxidoreductase [Aurantiacibacter sediminis]MBH5323463.1 2-hydroxyacid dehydrogenase [Aurantiacibacter sediminis]
MTKYDAVQIAAFPVPESYTAPTDLVIKALFEESNPQGWLEANGAGIPVMLSHSGVAVTADMIAAMPDLMLVANFGVGVDLVDHAALERRGVVLTHTPDALTDDVADMAMALMLGGIRRIGAGDRLVRAGRWSTPLTRSVRGLSLGILGLGRIGSEIARLAAAFGMDISYHNRSAIADSPYQYANSPVELARTVDVLVAAIPGGGSEPLISDIVIEAIGPDGLFVNIARGSVVDESALLDALENGSLGAAALDVFMNEPKIDPRFMALDNVLLSPHRGSATEEARIRMANETYANAANCVAGRSLVDIYRQR